MKYVAVSHVYNEEKSVTRMVNSLRKLVPKPDAIVIVDDGSTDSTHKKLDRLVNMDEIVYVAKITLDKFPQAYLCRSRAFKLAVDIAEDVCPDWEYMLKVDGDCIVPPNYIRRLLAKMNLDPKLGIASGVWQGGKLWAGRASNGAILYRRNCWDDIAPPAPIPAWDTHLMLKAYQRGWWSTGFPGIPYTELRPSDKHTFKEYYITGIARHLAGFTPYHVILVGLLVWRRTKYYIRSRLMPLDNVIKYYMIGGFILMLSYFIYYARHGKPRYFDDDYYEYMKRHSFWETVLRYRLVEKTVKYKLGVDSASEASLMEDMLPVLPPEVRVQ